MTWGVVLVCVYIIYVIKTRLHTHPGAICLVLQFLMRLPQAALETNVGGAKNCPVSVKFRGQRG